MRLLLLLLLLPCAVHVQHSAPRACFWCVLWVWAPLMRAGCVRAANGQSRAPPAAALPAGQLPRPTLLLPCRPRRRAWCPKRRPPARPQALPSGRGWQQPTGTARHPRAATQSWQRSRVRRWDETEVLPGPPPCGLLLLAQTSTPALRWLPPCPPWPSLPELCCAFHLRRPAALGLPLQALWR